MSYDINIFLFQEEGDPVTYFEELEEKEEEGNNPKTLELLEACNRLAASNLVSCNSERNDYFVDDQYEIQIDTYSSYVSLSMPYWHDETEAKLAFQKLESIYAVINEKGNWLIYDPQEGEVKDSIIGENENNFYSETVESVKGILSGSTQKQPWWKFW